MGACRSQSVRQLWRLQSSSMRNLCPTCSGAPFVAIAGPGVE